MDTSPDMACRTRSGSSPTPSSSTEITHSRSKSSAMIVMWPLPSLPSRPWRTAFSTSGWRARKGTATGSTSGATRSVTWSRSPNRAFSSTRYRSIERSSSARVVNSPCLRKEYRVKSAKSRSSSRARSGSVRTNDAIAVSEL